VKDAALELALPDQDALDLESPRWLVEPRLVRPGAAVDVVDRRVPIALEMDEVLELAHSLVHEALDRDLLDLTAAGELEVAGSPRVREEARGEEDPCRRAVRPAQAGERILAPFFALVERRAVEDAPAAVVLELVQHRVPDRVRVDEHDP